MRSCRTSPSARSPPADEVRPQLFSVVSRERLFDGGVLRPVSASGRARGPAGLSLGQDGRALFLRLWRALAEPGRVPRGRRGANPADPTDHRRGHPGVQPSDQAGRGAGRARQPQQRPARRRLWTRVHPEGVRGVRREHGREPRPLRRGHRHRHAALDRGPRILRRQIPSISRRPPEATAGPEASPADLGRLRRLGRVVRLGRTARLQRDGRTLRRQRREGPRHGPRVPTGLAGGRSPARRGASPGLAALLRGRDPP